MNNIVNFILFQIAWFAVVLGAANGMPWLGVAAVPGVLMVHIARSADRKTELFLALAAAVTGFFTDTFLISLGAFSPVPYIFPSPFSSLWMVMLWVNLAMTLNLSLGWLRGRYALAAVFASFGGPLAYLGGARLGAMTEMPQAGGLLAIGAAWAIAFPALLQINELLGSFFRKGRRVA